MSTKLLNQPAVTALPQHPRGHEKSAQLQSYKEANLFANATTTSGAAPQKRKIAQIASAIPVMVASLTALRVAAPAILAALALL